MILLSLIGVLDSGTIATSSADKGVLLGYGHANTFAGSAGILIFLMFALHRNRIKSIHYFIAIIADVLIFYPFKIKNKFITYHFNNPANFCNELIKKFQ